MACAADVLTFYQERVANESYLRTATERVSLQEMAKLIGYRLRPGVAAETRLAFALETPKTPPPGLPPEPGAFVTGIPTSLTLGFGPARCKAFPVPTRSRRPSRRSKRSRRGPSGTRCVRGCPRRARPASARRRPGCKASRNNLKAGDALLFVGDEFLAHPTTNTNWDFRLIDSVEVETANDRTHVTWKRGLGSRVAACPIRRSRRRCTCCASAPRCSATTRRCGEA